MSVYEVCLLASMIEPYIVYVAILGIHLADD